MNLSSLFAVLLITHTPMPVAWGWHERAIFWANLALATVGIGGIVVAIFTLCFIKRQAIEMRRQRITMKKTLTAIRRQATLMETQSSLMERQTVVAETASLNAVESLNLFVNAERARMTMDIKGIGRSFTVDAKNTGKTTAKVTYGQGRNSVLPYGEALPLEPPYISEKEREGSYCEWINSGEKTDLVRDDGEYGLIADLSEVELCKDIRDKKVVLWVYGRICYEDGISPIKRETRFCYEASVDNNMVTYLAMSGPAVYRIET